MINSCYAKYFLFFSVGLLVYCSCKTKSKPLTIAGIENYFEYVNDADNGLIKIRKLNGFVVKIKFIPPDVQIYNQYKSEAATLPVTTIDSLRRLFFESPAFLFSIGPDTSKSNDDIMFTGIAEFKEYAERAHAMNFDFEQNMQLKMDSMSFTPVLSNMENTYGLTPYRNMLFVFEQTITGKTGSVEYVYNDDRFGLGKLYFVFKKEDLNNIPKLDFSKI